MKRFVLVRVCVCVIVLSSLCGVAVLVGRQQSEPAFIPELQKCGEMMCYLGILTGTTPWDEGMQIVRQAQQLKAVENSDRLFRNSDSGYVVGFLSGGTDGVVGEININAGEFKPLIGNVIEMLGLPCAVFMSNPRVNLMGLEYGNAVILVQADANQLTPESPVIHIVIHRANNQICQIGTFPSGVIAYGWKGFARYF